MVMGNAADDLDVRGVLPPVVLFPAAGHAAAGGSGPPVLKALLEVAPDLDAHTLAAKANNTGRAQAK